MAQKLVKRPFIEKCVSKYLSDDLLINILLKLPVRTLFSFRCVCKHWLSLIQNPIFIKLHFNRPVDSKTRDPLLVLQTVKSKPSTRDPTFYSTNNVITFLSDGDKTLDDYKYEVLSESLLPNSTGFVIGVEEVRLMGPCNGVFCITDTVDVALFNPATRKFRRLPPTHLTDPFECVGFGFDSISNDFKVVRFDEIILDHSDDDDDDEETVDDDDDDDDDNDVDHYGNIPYPSDLCVYKVEIFSLSTNRWREVESLVPAANMSGLFRCNVFVNGAFHWLQGYNSNLILVFDLHEESFKQFELPKMASYGYHVNLSVFNEYLAMVLCSSNVFVMWVMMEHGVNESWKKLYAIDIGKEIDRPLSFSKEEEFLLQCKDGKLVSFDLLLRTSKEIEVQGAVRTSVYAFRYRESLVVL